MKQKLIIQRIRISEKYVEIIKKNKQNFGVSFNQFVRIAVEERIEKLKLNSTKKTF